MAVQISCNDLGIQGCEFATSGDAPGDVVREVVEHVRLKHAIDLPDTDAILTGDIRSNYSETNPGAAVIVKRLTEILDTNPPSLVSNISAPPLNRTTNE